MLAIAEEVVWNMKFLIYAETSIENGYGVGKNEYSKRSMFSILPSFLTFFSSFFSQFGWQVAR